MHSKTELISAAEALPGRDEVPAAPGGAGGAVEVEHHRSDGLRGPVEDRKSVV